ncbi:alpha-(1,3)-fucosyltransferase C-like [Dermacentor albipictus]|uniref:alpha-(1,3)-fucosyltransferase C-like n=1 Tax=Dermacentor albipictus TaxID=60249 RepID=UPI0038FD1AA9
MQRPGLPATTIVTLTVLVTYYSLSLYHGRNHEKSTTVPQLSRKQVLPETLNSQPEVPMTNTTTASIKSPQGNNAWTPFYRRTRPDGQPDLPRILFWTTIYGYWLWNLTEEGVAELEYKGCPDRCIIANDRSTLNISDAVVFHGHELNPTRLPKERAPFQKWVYYSREPPWHCPVAWLKGLTNTINWTMTYRLDSDILDTYVRITDQKPALNLYSKKPLKRIWRQKSQMAAWAVSSCNTFGKREDYVRELRKYLDVDVYGHCGEKQCPRENEIACYKMFAKNYFFYLSFENCICKDYVTEKLFKLLNYDIVPVVYGGANYMNTAPPGSFIDALSFDSPMHLARHLKKVAEDYNLYEKYFQWKGKYNVKPLNDYTFCALCRKLHSEDFKKTSVVSDIYHWWNTTSYCRAWNRCTQKFEY